jgi:hypothetical protein
MSFDHEWYRALKGALVNVTEADRKALRAIWNYPGIPVEALAEKVGHKPGSGINLTIGNRIAKTKLWSRMPKRIKSRNMQRGGKPFYSGVLVRLTTVEDRDRRRLFCFDFHDEAVRALQELKIISLKRGPRSTAYKLVGDLDDSAIVIAQNAPAETKRVLRSIIARRGQNEFRKALLQAYGGTCAVTGCSEVAVLEAVHIREFIRKGRYELGNGLLLRADWHTLFDLKMWAIEPKTLQIRIASKISDSDYAKFHGRRIRLPTDPKCAPEQSALEYRYRLFRDGWLAKAS